MDRNILLEHLEQTRRHVATGEQHIALQRELITKLERSGRDSSDAKRLLSTFEELQKLHVADRDRLEKELGLSGCAGSS